MAAKIDDILEKFTRLSDEERMISSGLEASFKEYNDFLSISEEDLNKKIRDIQEKMSKLDYYINYAKSHAMASELEEATTPFETSDGQFESLRQTIKLESHNDPNAESLYTKATGQKLFYERQMESTKKLIEDSKKQAKRRYENSMVSFNGRKQKLAKDMTAYIQSDSFKEYLRLLNFDKAAFNSTGTTQLSDNSTISLGQRRVKLNLPADIEQNLMRVSNGEYNAAAHTIGAPFKISMKKGSVMFLDYDERNRQYLFGGIQRLLLNSLKYSGESVRDIFFCEPNSNSPDALGTLADLGRGEKPFITVPKSATDIDEKIAEFITRVEAAPTSDNVSHIAVINDFSEKYTDNVKARILYLSKNVERYGVLLILTRSNAAADTDCEKEIRSMGISVRSLNGGFYIEHLRESLFWYSAPSELPNEIRRAYTGQSHAQNTESGTPSRQPDTSVQQPVKDPENREPKPLNESVGSVPNTTDGFVSPQQTPDFAAPIQNAELSMPNQNVDPVVPNRNVDFSAPNRNVNFSAPNRNVNFSAPNRNVNFSAPNRNSDFSAPNRNPDFSVPNRNPDFSAPNRNPDFSVPNRNPDFSAPNRNPDFSVPNRNPDFSAPNRNPDFSVPNRNPDFSAPSRNPDFSVPNRNPDFSAPNRNPDFSAPNRNPDFSAPNRNPDFSAPNRNPDFSAPNRNPDFSVPNRNPDFSVPNRNPDFSAPNRNTDFSAPNRNPDFSVSQQISNFEIPQQTPNFEIPQQISNFEIPQQAPNFEVPQQTSNLEVSQQVSDFEVPQQIPAFEEPPQVPNFEIPQSVVEVNIHQPPLAVPDSKPIEEKSVLQTEEVPVNNAEQHGTDSTAVEHKTIEDSIQGTDNKAAVDSLKVTDNDETEGNTDESVRKGQRTLYGVVPGTNNSGRSVKLDINEGVICICGILNDGHRDFVKKIIVKVEKSAHPDDAELWIFDFGGEFMNFSEKPEPHIKYLISDSSTDFAYDLIDTISDEYSRRVRLFAENGWNRIDDVAAGKNMPNIVIIINDFSRMCNNIFKASKLFGKNYSEVLADIFDDCAVYGIHFILVGSSFTEEGEVFDCLKNGTVSSVVITDGKAHDSRILCKCVGISESDISVSLKKISEGNILIAGRNGFDIVTLSKDEPAELPKYTAVFEYSDELEEYVQKSPVIADRFAHVSFEDRSETRRSMISDCIDGEKLVFIGEPCRLTESYPVHLYEDFGENIIALMPGRDKLNPAEVVGSAILSLVEQNTSVELLVSRSNPIYAALHRAGVLQRVTVFEGEKSIIHIKELTSGLGSSMHLNKVVFVLGGEQFFAAMCTADAVGELKKLLVKGPYKGVHMFFVTSSAAQFASGFISLFRHRIVFPCPASDAEKLLRNPKCDLPESAFRYSDDYDELTLMPYLL